MKRRRRRSLMLQLRFSLHKLISPRLNQRLRKWPRGKLKQMLKLMKSRMLPICKSRQLWPRRDLLWEDLLQALMSQPPTRKSPPRRLKFIRRELFHHQSQRLKLRLPSKRNKMNSRLLIVKLRKPERLKLRMLLVRLLPRLVPNRKLMIKLPPKRRPLIHLTLMMRFGLPICLNISDRLKPSTKPKRK